MIFDDVFTSLIGLTESPSAADAATGHHAGKSLRLTPLCRILHGQIFEMKAFVTARIAFVSSFAMSGWVAAADYAEHIKPLLKARCVTCHGPVKQKAGLRVDAGQWILEGSKEGAILNPGDAAASALIERVSSDDDTERMPPEGAPLTSDEIAMLAKWIDAGAAYPADEVSAASPQTHWAFQSVKAMPIPAVLDESWVRNPIDRFVLSKLESKGWKPAAPASDEVLLRRIYLDLIGLPPTPEEQDAFARSPDPGAVIDDLLARKTFGERWARHWLDVVRYADTNGYERDATKPFVWRYRDYVIDSFNADKPYDRFLIEQLAGDELAAADAETVIATGYLRLGHWDDEPADSQTDRYDQLDDILNTTSQAMLGLTLACARCHDHKFEPLSQRDYYSLIAVFNPLQRPQRGRTELAIPAGTRAEVEALKQRDAAIAAIEKERDRLRAAFERGFLEAGKSELSETAVVAFLASEGRSAEQKKLVEEHRAALDSEIEDALPADLRESLGKQTAMIGELRRKRPDLPMAYAWQEPSNVATATHILVRGQAGRHGEKVQPGPPQIVAAPTSASFPRPDEHTTRQRLGLANWIASPENPLTARVMVNRVWKHHFGEGLVRSVNDFGLMGDPPTHPDLLEWLSHWFVHEADWSLKQLHRLILTSRTWQMSTRAASPSHVAEDPDNRLLSHQNYRRLEVEVIRDSILAVSGQLNREMYGPHTYPSIPPQALEGHSDPEKIWKPLDESSASRRTIYAYVKRSLMLPMLEVLDLCDTTQPSPGRRVTTVAPQALTLFNGEFANRQAHHFAARLRAEAGPDRERQIDLAWRLALCRPATKDEKVALLQFLEEESLEQLCRVVINLNEFVYAD